ncbi:UbiD family decarboxylase domain-containing protein [Escherichia coli]
MGATPLNTISLSMKWQARCVKARPDRHRPADGFDVPWGSEVILEGVIESRKREIEGPFGSLPGTAPAGVT